MDLKLYVVFAYSADRTKYVMGTYTDKESAINRQHAICEKSGTNIFKTCGSIYNSSITTFINEFPIGDGQYELFT